MTDDVTRAEQLAAQIRRACDYASDSAQMLVVAESIFKAEPTEQNRRRLDKRRRELSHALTAMNGPIRAYHVLLHPETRLTLPLRLLRWVHDCAARAASFRRGA